MRLNCGVQQAQETGCRVRPADGLSIGHMPVRSAAPIAPVSAGLIPDARATLEQLACVSEMRGREEIVMRAFGQRRTIEERDLFIKDRRIAGN